MKDDLTALKKNISSYNPADVLIMDECGLFYKNAPDRPVTDHLSQRRKRMKDRFTVLVRPNSDGSEKFKFMFVGTGLRPRAFKKKFGNDFGLDYCANRKAWMIGDLFNKWLLQFDAHYTAKGRKVILLIDNRSADRNSEELPEIKSVEVFYLPSNKTSKT